MQTKKIVPGVLAGLLVFGGVACSEDNPTSEVEDISPELDDEGGEGGVIEEDEEILEDEESGEGGVIEEDEEILEDEES